MNCLSVFNIGINHVFFYAFASAGPRDWHLNSSQKGEGFNEPLGVLADVSVLENHVWSLISNFVTRKDKCCITIIARKSMKNS